MVKDTDLDIDLQLDLGDACPVRNVMANFSGKWEVLILFVLSKGAMRFSELKREIGDVTQGVLTENLRGLEREGYLIRSVDAGPPIAVHYMLSEIGQDLSGKLLEIIVWSKENFPKIAVSRHAYDHAKKSKA